MTPNSNQPKYGPNNFAFIDSQNLNRGTQRAGFKLDWRKFRRFLADNYGVTRAYSFIGYLSENVSMYEYLHSMGYLVVLKPTKDVKQPSSGNKDSKDDDSEKTVVKGNVDVELVLYALKEMPNYDRAIIVSGDGDFYSLVEYLEEQHKLEHILTPNWRYSSLLKPFEDKITRLDQMKKQLAYRDRKRRPKPDTN